LYTDPNTHASPIGGHSFIARPLDLALLPGWCWPQQRSAVGVKERSRWGEPLLSLVAELTS
jgi:hypothetical protein